jgi:hypothetical protein
MSGTIPTGMTSPKVCLYCDQETSEVTAEWPSLHAAIGSMAPIPLRSVLICNSSKLATFTTMGWLLHSEGIERLTHEFVTKDASR